MLPPIDPPVRRFIPRRWGPMLRNRLGYFRVLTLVLALLTLWGLGVTFAFSGVASNAHRVALGIALSGLTVMWVEGGRRGRFANVGLVAEVGLLLLFMWGGRDDFGAFGLFYIALQYRSMFGNRRDAFLLAVTFGLTYLGGRTLLPDGAASTHSIVAVELVVGGFCAYLMHTLAEVLLRDQQRKQALRESEQRFRSVIENLREALLITDLNDQIILANARVLDVLGYEPGELIGQNASLLLLPAAAGDAFNTRRLDRVQGKSELYETTLRRKDGTVIHAEISASPYRDGAGAIIGTLGAISDISERKRLEGRLRQGMRLEAVGQLAGGVAHDFNNLLTVIKVHTELLLADLPFGDPNRHGIEEIEKSADRGASLTQQLLAFSRKQLLQPQRITLASVIANVMGTLRGVVSRQVTIVMGEHTEVSVFADPLQMEHILVALVRNANDAMTGPGRIEIATRVVSVQAGAEPVPNQEVPGGDYVLLSVSDTGPGMTPDVIARLFEPFVTTKSPGAGSGLGLASVYGSVRQHGGFIAAESIPGAGAVFRIWLPVYRAGARTRRAAELQLA